MSKIPYRILLQINNWVNAATLIGTIFGTGCNMPEQATSGNQATGNAVVATVQLASNQVADVTPITIYGNSDGIVVDSGGNIFYPDADQGVVEKVSSDGTQTQFANYGVSGGFATIAIDASASIYVAHPWSTITKITADGTVSTFATILNGNAPRLMTVDPSGNLYYTEMTDESISTNRIIKVNPLGVVSVFAGSGRSGYANGNGTSASFNNPQALAADSSGNIYVSDVGNFLIRKISPAGDVTTFAGNGIQGVVDGTGTSASFYFYAGGESGGGPIPAYLTFDSYGNLYVGDNAGATGYIRKITSSGVVTTYCGNGSGTNIDVKGSCIETGVWINNGLAAGPNGSLYFVSGSSLYGISSALKFFFP